jgi:large subunit ribosomal protein L2
MGTRIITQNRGKGGPTYTAPSHRYFGQVRYLGAQEKLRGEVVELVNSVGHSAPLMIVKYEDTQYSLLPAPIGIEKGTEVEFGSKEAKVGNVLRLGDIPTGSAIYNLEKKPYDGGKLVRSAGSSAFVVGKEGKKVKVKMPSKKLVYFHANCRATIGVVAGGGRSEKPFYKAGNKFKAMKARNKLYPKVCGKAMNACDHPYGGTHRRGRGQPSTISRHAPPGKKVGLIAARRTGKK